MTMAKAEGKHYKFNQLEFYAERGMISLIDTDLAADSSNTKQYHWRIPPGQFRVAAVCCQVRGPDGD